MQTEKPLQENRPRPKTNFDFLLDKIVFCIENEVQTIFLCKKRFSKRTRHFLNMQDSKKDIALALWLLSLYLTVLLSR